MVRRLKYILLGVLLPLIEVVGAQSLTLERCREMALESSHNLNSSGERVLISEDLLAAYKTNRLPNLSLMGNYLYSTASFNATIEGGYLLTFTNGVYNSETTAYMPSQSYDLKVGHIFNAGAMLTQPIYMGGKVSNAIKLACVGVEVSSLERRMTESQVLEMTDNAFYKVLQVEEMLLSAQKYEEVLSEFYRQMQSAHSRGMKTRNDLLKVEVRLNEAKLLTQKATNALRLSKMNLCYVVGLPLLTEDVTLTDTLKEGVALDDNNLDITSRPEYEMLSRQITAKELEAKISRGEFLPSLSALASYSYMNGVTINDAKLINSASFTGGVMLNVPIFHWGEGRRKTSAKEREVTIAQNQMEDLSQQMTLELLQAINTYNESLLDVELSTSSVAQAQENMRLSRSQYDAGLETIADYLESQALWQQAMSELCTARAEQRTAYTRYQRCRGEL